MAISSVEFIEEKRTDGLTIENAHEAFDLSYVQLASVLGVSRRTLLRYRKHMGVPSPMVLERMEALQEIHHLLEKIFADENGKMEWLYTPVPLLEGKRPIDLMLDGKLDRVLSVLAGFYAGVYI